MIFDTDSIDNIFLNLSLKYNCTIRAQDQLNSFINFNTLARIRAVLIHTQSMIMCFWIGSFEDDRLFRKGKRTDKDMEVLELALQLLSNAKV